MMVEMVFTCLKVLVFRSFQNSRKLHEEGGHTFPSTPMSKHDQSPPKIDVVKPTPRRGVEVVYVKSILDHLPNPDRGAALEKKM
jgi:hypothetical protein